MNTNETFADLDSTIKRDYGEDYEGGLNFRIGWLRSMVICRDKQIAKLEAEIERLKNAE